MSLGQGHFLPQGLNLNKHGRGPPGDTTYQCQGSKPDVSDKVFSCFPYIGLCKTCDPGGRPFLAPGI